MQGVSILLASTVALGVSAVVPEDDYVWRAILVAGAAPAALGLYLRRIAGNCQRSLGSRYIVNCSFISSISLCIASICSFVRLSFSSFSEAFFFYLQLACEFFFFFLQLLYFLLNFFSSSRGVRVFIKGAGGSKYTLGIGTPNELFVLASTNFLGMLMSLFVPETRGASLEVLSKEAIYDYEAVDMGRDDNGEQLPYLAWRIFPTSSSSLFIHLQTSSLICAERRLGTSVMLQRHCASDATTWQTRARGTWAAPGLQLARQPRSDAQGSPGTVQQETRSAPQQRP
jgi:hypothetical protein